MLKKEIIVFLHSFLRINKMISSLKYHQSSLLIIDSFQRGIPIEQGQNVLLLANKSYLLGRKDAESKRKEASNLEDPDERDGLAIRCLDFPLIEELTLEAKRMEILQEFIPAFLHTADSSYLCGYVDVMIGIPQNDSKYNLDFGILFKIAHAKDPTAIQ